MSFELGPIRPPSEARSLLVRITRNCPWNRCSFCPVYKGKRFSIRSVKEIKADLKVMGQVAKELKELSISLGLTGEISLKVIHQAEAHGLLYQQTMQIAFFLAKGGKQAFLQDANSLVMPASQLCEVLSFLKQTFPFLTRITSYVRSHTLTRRSLDDLTALRQAGLNRVHVGLESGSDTILALGKKGVNAQRQIQAGLKAKAAGFELSEYLMPGLGGKTHSQEHALESARVLSAIDPHFIRLRTTTVAPNTELAQIVKNKQLILMDDFEVVKEIQLFLENLEVTSLIQSDHMLNLLPELEGQLPQDKPRLLAIIEHFLNMEHKLQKAFILGRRSGHLAQLKDLENPFLKDRALNLLDQVELHYQGDFQSALKDLMSRFL